MSKLPYDDTYYAAVSDNANRSASAIVPLVLELVQPASVIDVGCGEGAWLRAFGEHGVADHTGVDGHAVTAGNLLIPPSQFVRHDLSRPLELGRRYDLVVSLEVAEHLPATCAATFVDSLARLGDVVLFSAAIPGQGGENHVNEQWPAYWAERFAAHRFVPVDCLRRRIWAVDSIAYWYAQNLIFYVRRDALEHWPRLAAEYREDDSPPASLVHPAKYEELRDWIHDHFSDAVKQ